MADSGQRQDSRRSGGSGPGQDGDAGSTEPEAGRLDLSEDEWRQRLGPEAFEVTRNGATERPFTSPWLENHADGSYHCVGCGARLFDSGTKFESGSGWPSFTAPSARERVELREDRSHGMTRTEVRCRSCGAHLGHVFDDGPAPTGQRYCINGVALGFQPESS